MPAVPVGFHGERLFNQDGHLDLVHYTRDMLDPDSPLHVTENAVERCLHLLAPVEVVVAATGGQAEVLSGRVLPAQGLPLADGSSGAVCMACVDVMPWPTRGAR